MTADARLWGMPGTGASGAASIAVKPSGDEVDLIADASLEYRFQQSANLSRPADASDLEPARC